MKMRNAHPGLGEHAREITGLRQGSDCGYLANALVGELARPVALPLSFADLGLDTYLSSASQ